MHSNANGRPAGRARRTVGSDFLASIVVFLVALPLCMGIAIASGAPVVSGLVSGIVGGIVVGALAGSPLQVSGPAAGLTVIVAQFVQQHGFPALGAVILVGGLIQAGAAVLRLGQWFRAVSPAVVRGMLSGIGVLIFASQFHVMVDDSPKESGLLNLATIPRAVEKGLPVSTLGPPEEREFKIQSLREVGDLHRRQDRLAEEIAKLVIPAGPAAGPRRAELLAPFHEQQQELAAEVQARAAEIETFSFASESGDSIERIRAAARSALRHGRNAEQALQSGADAAAVAQTQARAVQSLARLAGRLKNHDWAAKIGLLTIAILIGWQAFAPPRLRPVPAPLVAVVTATVVAGAVAIPVLYVEAPANFFGALDLPSWTAWSETPLSIIMETGLVLAIIASTETLLCAAAVDRLHNGPRTQYDRELFAQGVGNTLCGLIGGLPITGVIVRSSANVQAGARTRLSAILHGAWLLAFVALFPALLSRIPTAALAAILVYTGYKLIDFKAIRDLNAVRRMEAVIYVATLVGVVAVDLLSGVLIGMALSVVDLLYRFSKLRIAVELDEARSRAMMKLRGAATFLRLPMLAAELERVPGGAELHVDFHELTYIDHTCLDLFTTWAQQHESAGGRLVIDWDSLHARFRSDPLQHPPRGAGSKNGAAESASVPEDSRAGAA
jgi:MFS superfamily sulfate permease-like transporter